MDVRAIQTELKRCGFDPGPIDGAWGAKTRAAVRRFQDDRRLTVDGLVGPQTLKALFPAAHPIAITALEPPWYAEAKRRMGLHEVRDKKALWDWLKSDGKQLGDPSKLPWCGDFVATALALTTPDDPQPTNPYWAQNWQKFGVPLGKPALGAVLVFVRPGGGHVGFCAGADSAYYAVLGGNQSNAVTIARIERSRCIGIRWPKTYPLPSSFALVTAAGAISKNEA
ncbi:MAG: TIGR02594 family protein [Beijerinckiaceae bacterium]|nr:TIGR02594 family protein [Beijerinckiaceae bacterium]